MTKKEQMDGTIVEYIHGMPVIKVFNRTLSAFQRFEASVTDYTNIIEKITRFFASRMGGFTQPSARSFCSSCPPGFSLP